MPLAQSKALEYKAALATALREMTNGGPLDGLAFVYNFPGRDFPTGWVLLGPVTWTKSDWATNRRKEEDFSVQFILHIQERRTDCEALEAKAAGLAGSVEDFLHGNPTLGIGNVITASLAPERLGSWPEDGSYSARLEGQVSVTARF